MGERAWSGFSNAGAQCPGGRAPRRVGWMVHAWLTATLALAGDPLLESLEAGDDDSISAVRGNAFTCALPLVPQGGTMRCGASLLSACPAQVHVGGVIYFGCTPPSVLAAGSARNATCGKGGAWLPKSATAGAQCTQPQPRGKRREAESLGAAPPHAAANAHAHANTGAVDTVPPIRLALRNMDGVIDAMLQIEALSAKLRTRLRAELQALSTTWRHQRAEVQQLMQADALVNKVPVSTLDPADYGLPADPDSPGDSKKPRQNMGLEVCTLEIPLAESWAARCRRE